MDFFFRAKKKLNASVNVGRYEKYRKWQKFKALQSWHKHSRNILFVWLFLRVKISEYKVLSF